MKFLTSRKAEVLQIHNFITQNLEKVDGYNTNKLLIHKFYNIPY